MAKKRTILVVEDSPTVLQMIKMHLEHAGHSVLTSTSTETAFEILNANQVDFVLCDIVLESKDAKTGYHVLKHIRATPKLKDIPVYMMSDQRNAENAKVTALRLGANGFIAKPFKMDTLDTLVKKSLSDASTVKTT